MDALNGQDEVLIPTHIGQDEWLSDYSGWITANCFDWSGWMGALTGQDERWLTGRIGQDKWLLWFVRMNGCYDLSRWVAERIGQDEWPPWLVRSNGYLGWFVRMAAMIGQSQILNSTILKFNSPVLLNQLGNIFSYRSRSTGSVLENILPVELGVYFPVNSQWSWEYTGNIAPATVALRIINSINIALPGRIIQELYFRMSVLWLDSGYMVKYSLSPHINGCSDW